MMPLPHAVPGYTVKQHWHERFHADPGNAWLRGTVAGLPEPQGSHAETAPADALSGHAANGLSRCAEARG